MCLGSPINWKVFMAVREQIEGTVISKPSRGSTAGSLTAVWLQFCLPFRRGGMATLWAWYGVFIPDMREMSTGPPPEMTCTSENESEVFDVPMGDGEASREDGGRGRVV